MNYGQSSSYNSLSNDTEITSDQIEITEFIDFNDIIEPSNPGTAKGRLYKLTGDDGLWYKPNAAGIAVDLTTGGGGGGGDVYSSTALSVDNEIVVYNGLTGKLIKNSDLTILKSGTDIIDLGSAAITEFKLGGSSISKTDGTNKYLLGAPSVPSTGVSNRSIGVTPVFSTGSRNLFISTTNPLMETGNNNIALGHNANSRNLAGSNVIAVGTRCLENYIASNSISVGTNSCKNLNVVGAVRNVVIGNQALQFSLTSNNMTSIGHQSGLNATGNAGTNIGMNSGMNSLGNLNVFIGFNADGGNFNRQIAIGADALCTEANQFMCGPSTLLSLVPNVEAICKLGSVTNGWTGVYSKPTAVLPAVETTTGAIFYNSTVGEMQYSNGVSYISMTGGGSGTGLNKFSVRDSAVSDTFTNVDYVINGTGSGITLTLPLISAATLGVSYMLISQSAGIITLGVSGADLISNNGDFSSISLASLGQRIEVFCNGFKWYVK